MFHVAWNYFSASLSFSILHYQYTNILFSQKQLYLLCMSLSKMVLRINRKNLQHSKNVSWCYSSCSLFLEHSNSYIHLLKHLFHLSNVLFDTTFFPSEYYQVFGVCAFQKLCISFVCYVFRKKKETFFYVTVTGIWNLDIFSGSYVFLEM